MTLLFVALTLLISIPAFYNPAITDRFILSPYKVDKMKQYYRFLTSGFLHANWLHLLFNMFALFSFGSIVEQYYNFIFPTAGTAKYVLLYLLGIIMSDIPTYFRHKNHPYYGSLGASGGVAAIIFASVLFDPWAKLLVLFIPMPAILFGVLYLVYSGYMANKEGDHINHSAHFYGSLFGIVYTLTLDFAGDNQMQVLRNFIENLTSF